MIFFLHVGMPKTGTTTIQKFLASNRSQLQDQGFLYPRSVGNNSNHLKLAAFAMDADKADDLKTIMRLFTPAQVYKFRQKLVTDFRQEIEAEDCNKVILSNEHCSTRLTNKHEIENLKEFLCQFCDDVRIIIYLRRQDESLLSAYSTAVKVGRSEPLSLPNQKERLLRYNYWEILEKWDSVFGKDKISVKIFERDQLFKGDLLKDFNQEIKLDINDKFIFQSDANLSLDHECCEFLRRFNQYVPRFIDNELNAKRKNIVNLLENYSGSSRIGISREIMNEFMNSFSDSNRKVAKHYLNRSDGMLFLQDFSDRNRVEIDREPLSMDKAFEIFAYLWNQKQDEIMRQENRPLSTKFMQTLRSFKRKIGSTAFLDRT